MGLQIVSELKKLWDTWDIPACVLLSLLLQVHLAFFALLRQRSKNGVLVSLIWLAYLAANTVAAFTIGLITKVQTDPSDSHGSQGLYALWACFLLLHLGGPDTITSFALEDNEFWLRHLFGLILQVIAASNCIFLTINPNNNNNLRLPTILVLVVGSVRYAERTVSLYLASYNHVRDTVGDAGIGTKFDLNPANYSEESSDGHMELLMVSYSLFKSFKGFVFERPRSSKLIKSCRTLFQKVKEKPNLGFKLIEYQLSFMYEVLHTKVAVVSSRIGLVFRLSSFCLTFGAFLLFHFDSRHDGKYFGGFELSLTYALFIGAIGIDTISGIQHIFFSDWILVSNYGLIRRWRKYIPQCVLKRKRWSESVSGYNMIDYCLNERWIWKCNKYIPGYLRVMIDNIKFMLFSSSSSVDEELKRFIFQGLNEWTSSEGSINAILKWTANRNYAPTVLQLHLATEICYHQSETELESYTDEIKSARRMSKLISDYMFYLLIMKPELIGVKENWEKVFQDTFEEAIIKLMKNKIYDHVKACKHFMGYREEGGSRGKGTKDSSKSLLSSACKEGQEIESRKWNGMSDQWLGLLFIATKKCRPILLAQQTSKGGELFTLISLLIDHIGFYGGNV